ncbi:hypothetical protein BKH43_02935 [Helicobacter sp. 13S00401-1]|uniref:methionyl-tRNA formyltransferase n=1 Tax=Helicobacter sp. 13S00401-1 TaxID=1905758 RepID=UPI000BA5F66A|nr:methionyl-tRNA formyltransferase [Helicobacter sp. 13S00401-1]PAF51178.1 hypothetical protein BKH43_02935 [Helicobacter sp. 13S00401-1]
MRNILFCGTPKFAKDVLELLSKRYNIVGVLTQQDKGVGRKRVLTPPPVKEYALSLGIKTFQPANLKSPNLEIVMESLSHLEIDIVVVVAYGQILPKSFIDTFTCINLHGSLLPSYRGASPMQQMILSDDKEYGLSVIRMDYGLDSGDILGTWSVQRSEVKDFNLEMLFNLFAKEGSKLLSEVIDNIDFITPIKQDETKATYCKKIAKSDGLVDFEDASNIYKRYLAFFIWPGVFLESNLKLHDVSLKELDSINEAGVILEMLGTSIVVGCKKGSLIIGSLTPDSKSKMLASSYLQSKKLKVGDKLV